ncbi:MAG: RNA-binding protein [Planctomycetota bacterium]|nr:RNA-binding protein [Planctomycetota bacterium]MDI6787245.1 RNA-binding protein [Planctomycetota bacterium]
MANTKLYVGNLSYQTTEETLRGAFGAHGQVVSVTIIAGKGFGFVEMDSAESAQKAKDALNNAELEGRNIKVDEARPKREDGPRGPRQRYEGGGGYNRRY